MDQARPTIAGEREGAGDGGGLKAKTFGVAKMSFFFVVCYGQSAFGGVYSTYYVTPYRGLPSKKVHSWGVLGRLGVPS